MASCRPLASQFQQTNLEARYFHSIAKNSESAVVSLQSESISTAMLKADRIQWPTRRSKRKPEAGVLKSGDLMTTAKPMPPLRAKRGLLQKASAKNEPSGSKSAFLAHASGFL